MNLKPFSYLPALKVKRTETNVNSAFKTERGQRDKRLLYWDTLQIVKKWDFWLLTGRVEPMGKLVCQNHSNCSKVHRSENNMREKWFNS